MRPRRQSSGRRGALLSVEEVAFLTGTNAQVIRRITRLELLRPARSEPEPRFEPAVLVRVRRMLRMHRQLDVSWTSMALVLELLDRVEDLRSEVNRLRTPHHCGRANSRPAPDA